MVTCLPCICMGPLLGTCSSYNPGLTLEQGWPIWHACHKRHRQPVHGERSRSEAAGSTVPDQAESRAADRAEEQPWGRVQS